MQNIDENALEYSVLPLLPLRDVVVFPHMVIPLFVGRPKSIKALEAAMEEGKNIVLIAQKAASKDDPAPEDLFAVGTVATILQMLKLPDGTVKVLVEGLHRARILHVLDVKENFEAEIAPVLEDEGESNEVEALRRNLFAQFDQYVKLNKKIPQEVLTSLSGIDGASRLSDTIAAHLPLKLEQKQAILETDIVLARLEQLLSLIDNELDILQVEKKIRGRVKRQMEKSQREYYLNEQVKAIQRELGESEDGAEFDELDKKIKAAHLPKDAKTKAEAELKKLRLMSPMSAEATVIRNYIDILTGLPWKKKSKVNIDLNNAEAVLDADHYGLDKVKERIVEYLAVQSRVDKLKAPILCLVGPPGVGKTSLGQSIAKATNRQFVRMSLGGVRDEAEIRGHRRTYIGSMPGKILQNMAKVGVRNPLFLLDEVDKMGQDFRGDPASALLEVLDPEQNHTFVDHYVEVEYDLSDVMFVATSNTLNMPGPLLDRMEIIRLAGYTEDEKVHIAKQYLLPKQIKANGLKAEEMTLSDDAMRDIARYYTREAGVRGMDREIAKICRKAVKAILTADANAKKVGDAALATLEATAAAKKKVLVKPPKTTKAPKDSAAGKLTLPIAVSPKNLEQYLGVHKYSFGIAEKKNQVGQVTGLAWTEVGGELLTVEAAKLPGKGKIETTGKLGDVMQESIKAAMSVVRSRAQSLGIAQNFHETCDIHIHVPDGATPKDGPSAGAAMTTALVSILTGIPVRCDVAMTGEITLRGEVLPIGGLKEKLLAAARGGIKVVLIPEENKKDLTEIPEEITRNLEIIPVRWIDAVLETALERKPEPLADIVDATAVGAPAAVVAKAAVVTKH